MYGIFRFSTGTNNPSWENTVVNSRNHEVSGTYLATCLLLLIAATSNVMSADYQIQPGDVLAVSVWKEEDLQHLAIVRPDGKFSFPLTGDVVASGRSVEEVRAEVVKKIETFIPEPVVTVQLQQIVGNKIFVIGKVQRPGAFLMTQEMDVMQALSEAGGMVTFAEENQVSVLRREADGSQVAIPFRFGDVKYGKNLSQNVLLQPGDLIVVP